jgi:hypothetical protein
MTIGLDSSKNRNRRKNLNGKISDNFWHDLTLRTDIFLTIVLNILQHPNSNLLTAIKPTNQTTMINLMTPTLTTATRNKSPISLGRYYLKLTTNTWRAVTIVLQHSSTTTQAHGLTWILHYGNTTTEVYYVLLHDNQRHKVLPRPHGTTTTTMLYRKVKQETVDKPTRRAPCRVRGEG